MTRFAPLNGVATSNWAERDVVAHLNQEGWGVLKNGWPDFLVQNSDGDVRFIEVKPNCTNGLSARQEKVAQIFLALGLVVELYAARCLCGDHDDSMPFKVGEFPDLPQRRIRRSELAGKLTADDPLIRQNARETLEKLGIAVDEGKAS